ncbi:acetoin utilization protein AcuC [Egicoccus halophilus]|uniref:Acetoin utilization protein AcuC n=1 Tax=Egicoccus halophilus TaxID=1670830 RepID=A0A8J3EUD5_9ACTN|nr:acetoin utilization protein AcuC [Egicoccus halophilus]GGI05645.1 acetoin utilization protein AcuC [Egicoccus halophilus]
MAGRSARAAGRVALLWDDRLGAYDLGPEHPLAPVRVELTMALIRDSGLVGGGAVEVAPGPIDEAELLRLHRPDFVDTVKRLSADATARADDVYGLGPGDTPAFVGMHATSLLVCAASKEAARQVWEGEADHAFNPAGGLHHAMPDRAAGFCIYNDPAVAIDWLLEHGAERIAYVDVDVHHGDGVEVLFADDPRVLTISLHESGRFLFPGTGHATDIGGAGAPGSAANVPLHPGTTGDVWLGAFDAVVEPLVRAFAPDVLVTQLGCDTHASDPLAHLALTVDDDARIYRRLHELAHEVCDGRWVAFGGGGYQVVQVVPRAWTLAFAEMSGRAVPVDTPMTWQELAVARTGRTPPRSFTDDPVDVGAELHAQARRAAEESVEAVRRLVLPHHGVAAPPVHG